MIELLMNMDAGILLWIQEHLRTEWLNPVFAGITSLGNGGMIWMIWAVLLMFFKKTRITGILCVTALGMSVVLNNFFLKNLVERARPFDTISSILPLIPRPTDYSFPSGHTAASFACAWVILRKLPKSYGVAAAILAGLIAFSRLYVGVHYPSDVLVGMVSGILIGGLAEHMPETLFFYRKEARSR